MFRKPANNQYMFRNPANIQWSLNIAERNTIFDGKLLSWKSGWNFFYCFNDLANHLINKIIMNFQMVTTLIAILTTWYIGQTSKDIMTGEMIPTIRTLSPIVVLLTMVSMSILVFGVTFLILISVTIMYNKNYEVFLLLTEIYALDYKEELLMILLKLSKLSLNLHIQWVGDCYLTTNEKYSTYIMVRPSYIRWYDTGIHFVLDQQAYLDLLRHALWNSDTLVWFLASKSLLVLLTAACLPEKQ